MEETSLVLLSCELPMTKVYWLLLREGSHVTTATASCFIEPHSCFRRHLICCGSPVHFWQTPFLVQAFVSGVSRCSIGIACHGIMIGFCLFNNMVIVGNKFIPPLKNVGFLCFPHPSFDKAPVIS